MRKFAPIETKNVISFICFVVVGMIVDYKPLYILFLTPMIFDKYNTIEKYHSNNLYIFLNILIQVLYLYLTFDFIATVPMIYKDIVNYTLKIISNGI